MYPKKEYIGTPQEQAIPMYLPIQVYQIKQPALQHNLNSKLIAAQIIVRPACAGISCEGIEVYSREIKLRLIGAGIYCERWQVESWEINWNTSGLEENMGFRCMLDLDASG